MTTLRIVVLGLAVGAVGCERDSQVYFGVTLDTGCADVGCPQGAVVDPMDWSYTFSLYLPFGDLSCSELEAITDTASLDDDAANGSRFDALPWSTGEYHRTMVDLEVTSLPSDSELPHTQGDAPPFRPISAPILGTIVMGGESRTFSATHCGAALDGMIVD